MTPSPQYLRKIMPLERLLATLDAHRREGRRIVQCHGCFDIVHPGHVRYLEFARRQGDVLLVSLTGDSEIDKGAQRPYIPQELRAENLAALESVDLVYVDPNPTAEFLLGRVKPDLYIKGKEYETSTDRGFLQERSIVERHGGRVVFSSGDVVFSSSRLIGSMAPEGDLEAQRLHRWCNRHGLDELTLNALAQRFAGLKVLVLGDTIIDRYVLCDPIDVASEGPMLSLATLDEKTYVGGAAIVARHVAAMGAQAVLVSSAGEDDGRRVAEQVLKRENIRAHLFSGRQRTVQKTRYLVDDSKLLKVEVGERSPWDSVRERQVLATVLDEAEDCDAVILCDFGYGAITTSILSMLLPRLRPMVRILAADVSGTHGNLLDFQDVDLLCPTEREMRQALHDPDGGLSTAAWGLMQRTRSRHLFVTLDKRGLVVFNRRSDNPSSAEWSARLRSEHVPALCQRLVDRLGCGDALLAAATLSLAAGGTAEAAAYLGSAAAALEIECLGNIPIPLDRLLAWLSERPELRVEQADSIGMAAAVFA